ncbi:MAG: FliG C-terminal domain-containing protein [Candidatus Poribacteria bacterium]
MRNPRERRRRETAKTRGLPINPVSPTERAFDGRARTVGLLRQMSDEARNSLLSAVAETDAQLSEQLHHEVYLFGDLVQLDERDLTRLTNAVWEEDRDLFSLALRRCNGRLKLRMLQSLPSLTRDQISYRIETMGQRRLSHVEQAQHKIVDIAKGLARAGQITLFASDPDDPFV